MNFENFRRTGELSDITVIVDKTEFKLHTFPLFTKSDYFKKEVAASKSSAPYVIRLDNEFPGGAAVFNQLADYFYSIPITIDQKNVVSLRAAACFIQCDELGSLIDRRFDELLRFARLRIDLTIPLVLLDQCRGEFEPWAKQTKMIEKCLQTITDCLLRGAGVQLSKSDREIIVRLPVEWVIQLIESCPNENKFATLPFAKHYISVLVLDQTLIENNSVVSGPNGDNHPSAFTPVLKKDDLPVINDDEKKSILDQIVKVLGHTIGRLPLTWLHSAHEKAVQLNCDCQSILSSYITKTILNSTDFEDGIENLPEDVMASLLERITKHQEEQIKDPQLLSKLSSLIDSHIEQLRQRGKLTSEQFIKLASCIPKEQRTSHDSLLLALNEILNNENSSTMSEAEREQLLNHIDFSRINEDTINVCKNNKLIPQRMITEAALSLCIKLRNQLDEARNHLRLAEHEVGKSRPSYTSPSYRTRHYESSIRTPLPRSRISHTSSYDTPLSSSLYHYPSRYDSDLDLDYLLPSRYLTASVLARYGW